MSEDMLRAPMTRFRLAGFMVCAIQVCAWGAMAAAQARAGADGREFVRVTPDTVKWMDYAGDGAQFGIKQAYIYGDPSKPGLYIIRILFPPGVMSTPHSHPETRIATVIKGTWWTGDLSIGAGSGAGREVCVCGRGLWRGSRNSRRG